MITILGVILFIFGLLGLFSPKTPLGQRINSILGIELIYYETFRKIVFYNVIVLLITIVYLTLLVIDFYRIQLNIFIILYLFTFPYLFIFISYKEYKLIFIKHILVFLSFLAVIGMLSYIFNFKIDNNKFKSQYDNCMSNDMIRNHLFLKEPTIIEFRDRYTKEYMLTSRLNKLFIYQEKYWFDIDLSLPKYNQQTVYTNLYNEVLDIYNNTYFHPSAKKYFENATRIKRNKKIYLTPVEVQPAYVGNSIIQLNAKPFASLAVGSKILILDFFLKALSNIKLIGVYFSLPFIILLSLFLTKKISIYNNKYEVEYNNKSNYFFMFSTILGSFLTLLSLL